jgi:tetratricopeptide (TPR) repeat protein
MRIGSGFLILFLLIGSAGASARQTAASEPGQKPRNAAPGTASGQVTPGDPAKLFEQGQNALGTGKLDEAERAFRQVLAVDPHSGGAYANLGVVYMRRKQWTKALETLHKAEGLLPQVAGIRLNIGLAYYRQNEFLKAIPPFETVVRDQPDALQPRYLLGLCYFFADRWADAANALEPLWERESTQPHYLYVLSKAANKAGKKELDEKAWAQLMKVGEGVPEFHLLMGKEQLQLGQYDLALSELQAAAQADQKLPFVHFNLGLTYLKKQEYEHARDEFLKDAALEPELALNYEQLGDVYALMQQDGDAEKSYRDALRRDSRLTDSYLGLAKIYRRQEKYAAALLVIDSAVKLGPERTDVHYLRGQTLLHLGRKDEARKEMETSMRLDNERRAQHEKQIENQPMPSPELVQEQQ